MSHLPIAVMSSSGCDFISYCIDRSAIRHRNLARISDIDSSDSYIQDTIIICSTRDSFMREILIELHIQVEDNGLPPQEHLHPQESRVFLNTPISMLQTTDTISMVYCPTIHHLRAYVSSLTLKKSHQNDAHRPYLAIHALLPQHYASTEWSSQGLSRSLSSLVESSALTSHDVFFSVHPDSVVFGIDAELPLINRKMMKNNSKKKAFYGGEGFEENDQDGAERDLRFIGAPRDVIKRWCKIVDLGMLVEERVVLNAAEEVENSSQVMLI